jgi:hypothetical protein
MAAKKRPAKRAEKEPDVESMRQEISDDLIDLSDDQVRAMWRAMRSARTKG